MNEYCFVFFINKNKKKHRDTIFEPECGCSYCIEIVTRSSNQDTIWRSSRVEFWNKWMHHVIILVIMTRLEAPMTLSVKDKIIFWERVLKFGDLAVRFWAEDWRLGRWLSIKLIVDPHVCIESSFEFSDFYLY